MIDLATYFCTNPNCKAHGIRGEGNLTINTQYGKNKTHLLRCKTCNQRFSENRNTIFLHSNYSREPTQRIILANAHRIRYLALDRSPEAILTCI